MQADGPPRFRKRVIAPYTPKRSAPDFHRGSARERGYDRSWDQFSAAYRRKHPLCEKCEQDGFDRPAAAVDHMHPLDDGGPKFALENVWALCDRCHNGWKRDLERFARATNQIERLPTWCRQPESRPARFRCS